MLCEICNPSDRAYIEHEDRMAIAVVILYMGGFYGADEVDGDFSVPLFAFGGNSLEWFREKAGQSLDDYIETHKKEVGEAFLSVRLAGSPEHYRLARKLEGKELEESHDRTRSSLNDFCRWAWKNGEKMLEKAAN